MSPARPEIPRGTWWNRLWRRFWVLPAVVASLSLLLGILLPMVDATIEDSPAWVFQGGVDGARSLLGAIAGAMISVTGLVFSITIVILQLASSQFTPRILGGFLESRITQSTLGIFTGSFLYALTVLRAVRGGDDGRVPHIAVTMSYVYVVVAVAMFLAFIHHITTSVQVSQVMIDVRRRTTEAVHRVSGEASRHQAGWSPRPETPRTELRNGSRCGYVTGLDGTGLVGHAAACGVVADLEVTPGDFLAPGQVVGRAWGRDDLGDEDAAALVATVHLGEERTSLIDPGFGVRKLLDIAERALSPGINDPTTAVQALNEVHVVLREMVRRPDASPYLLDDDGEVRAAYRPQGYAELLQLTVDELAHYGGDSLRVVPHLRKVLTDLVAAARPEHRGVTEAVLRRLDQACS